MVFDGIPIASRNVPAGGPRHHRSIGSPPSYPMPKKSGPSTGIWLPLFQ